MVTLPHGEAAQRAGRRAGHLLRQGHHLLVGPIPSTLPVRMRPHCSTHNPLASHLSLPIGGTQLGLPSPASTVRAASAETSSDASATSGPDRICHLRLGHLKPVVFI